MPQAPKGDKCAANVFGAALAIGLLVMPGPARSEVPETALEVQSWCRPYATVEVRADGMVYAPVDANTQFCWGAFAAIQELSVIVDERGKPLLRICPRASVTRVQFIQIFLHYANQHPEQADMDFAGVARRAIAEAFSCPPN